ncbi:MAG: hypothetical protein Q8P45_00100 [Candidatus Harrisonbacteria bacterium]|nr:hypothetical protein [Candidatus Harrisonbacteria bacterium]
MDTLFEAEIFFIITSAVVVVVGILLVIGLFYVLKIIRNIKEITSRIKSSVHGVTEDFDGLREDIKKDGLKWRHIAKIIPQKEKKRRRKKKK